MEWPSMLPTLGTLHMQPWRYLFIPIQGPGFCRHCPLLPAVTSTGTDHLRRHRQSIARQRFHSPLSSSLGAYF